MMKATARIAAVELKGFRSVQTLAKIQLADANLTGIVGPNGERILLVCQASSPKDFPEGSEAMPEYASVVLLSSPLLRGVGARIGMIS